MFGEARARRNRSSGAVGPPRRLQRPRSTELDPDWRGAGRHAPGEGQGGRERGLRSAARALGAWRCPAIAASDLQSMQSTGARFEQHVLPAACGCKAGPANLLRQPCLAASISAARQRRRAHGAVTEQRDSTHARTTAQNPATDSQQTPLHRASPGPPSALPRRARSLPEQDWGGCCPAVAAAPAAPPHCRAPMLALPAR